MRERCLIRRRAGLWKALTAVLCGVFLMLAFAGLGPVALLLTFVPYALAEGIVRPGSYVEMLDQPPTLVGTASALSSFTYGAITALATVAATLPWPSFLFGLNAVTVIVAILLVLFTWRFSHRWNLRDSE